MINHPETAEQIEVASFLRAQYPNVLFTGAFTEGHLNRGWRPRRGRISPGMRRKLMGYRAGTPDLFIFHRNWSLNPGIAIEMKPKKGGRVEVEQKDFLEALTKQGWIAVVCHGADEAKAVITKYMEEKR